MTIDAVPKSFQWLSVSPSDLGSPMLVLEYESHHESVGQSFSAVATFALGAPYWRLSNH
jgi:hypothetical protein